MKKNWNVSGYVGEIIKHEEGRKMKSVIVWDQDDGRKAKNKWTIRLGRVAVEQLAAIAKQKERELVSISCSIRQRSDQEHSRSVCFPEVIGEYVHGLSQQLQLIDTDRRFITFGFEKSISSSEVQEENGSRRLRSKQLARYRAKLYQLKLYEPASYIFMLVRQEKGYALKGYVSFEAPVTKQEAADRARGFGRVEPCLLSRQQQIDVISMCHMEESSERVDGPWACRGFDIEAAITLQEQYEEEKTR